MKNLEFKIELEGYGGICYDSTETQKDFLNKHYDIDYNENNVKPLQKNFYNEDCDFGIQCNRIEKKFVPIITSEMIKRAVLGDGVPPYASKDKEILMQYYAMPINIIRGWLNTVKDSSGYNKTHGLRLTDAQLINSAEPSMHIKTSNSFDIVDEKRASNSFYKKENLGHTLWETSGNLDVKELQFISASPKHNRMALFPDWVTSGRYLEILKEVNGEVAECKVGYFKSRGQLIPEFGVLLSNKFIEYLIKFCLKQFLQLYVNRASSFVRTKSIKVRLIYDITSLDDSKDNWIEIRSLEDIDALDFGGMPLFYEECTEEEVTNFEKIVEEEKRLREEEKKKDKKK